MSWSGADARLRDLDDLLKLINREFCSLTENHEVKCLTVSSSCWVLQQENDPHHSRKSFKKKSSFSLQTNTATSLDTIKVNH